MANHIEEIEDVRRRARNLARVPGLGEAGWEPASDMGFWENLDLIEAAGEACDETRAEWLAGFTQVDDLGPMGRALFLSTAALAALSRMPNAALRVARSVCDSLPPHASQYRKVGLVLMAAASGSMDALPVIQPFLSDASAYVRDNARYVFSRLSEHLGANSVLRDEAGPDE